MPNRYFWGLLTFESIMIILAYIFRYGMIL